MKHLLRQIYDDWRIAFTSAPRRFENKSITRSGRLRQLTKSMRSQGLTVKEAEEALSLIQYELDNRAYTFSRIEEMTRLRIEVRRALDAFKK